MNLSPFAETILIDGLDGGHMWGEPQNRLAVETLMDMRLVSSIPMSPRANGELAPRIPGGLSDSGVKLARKLKEARHG